MLRRPRNYVGLSLLFKQPRSKGLPDVLYRLSKFGVAYYPCRLYCNNQRRGYVSPSLTYYSGVGIIDHHAYRVFATYVCNIFDKGWLSITTALLMWTTYNGCLFYISNVI